MQFYVETVKQMAVCQLLAGSPLRTLCLLVAGQPADVFSADTTSNSSIYGAVNMSPQPSQVLVSESSHFVYSVNCIHFCYV